MSGLPSSSTWAMQQLAGFLASISSYPTVTRMVNGAAHRVAEALDAEVCAIVSGGTVIASVGFPAESLPIEDLQRVARDESHILEVPGVGETHAFAVQVPLAEPATLVVARSGEELDPDERHLVRAMTQVLELAVELRSSADRERELREATQRQAEELQRVNDRLVEAMNVKRDLIAVTSHELRTPIMTMLGFASVLSEGWRDFEDDERDEYLQVLRRHGKRLLALVDDLLTVGQLESDGVEVRPVEVHLGLAVAEIAGSHAWSDVKLRGARLSGTDEDDLVAVDLGHLEQMLTNLVGNARKYGREPIAIEVRAEDAGMVVEVSDDGDGVPAEFEAALFDRFTQASTGYHRDASGVGLGLAIVSGLANRNGADVRYSRREDRTCFTLTFPRVTDGGPGQPG